MPSSETPVAGSAAASAGRVSPPTISRVVAIIVGIFAIIGLLSILVQLRAVSQVRPPLFGITVGPAVSIAFSMAVDAASLGLAILVLSWVGWAVDGLIAVEAIKALNNCLYLLSPARHAFVASTLAQAQARMPSPAGAAIDPHTLGTIMSMSVSFGIVVGILIAVAFIVLLCVDRRRYRTVCLSR